MNGIVRAWVILVTASAATTLTAVFRFEGLWVVALLYLLALVKSRAILSDYLRLNEVPPIRRGALALFLAWAGVAMALAVAAQR